MRTTVENDSMPTMGEVLRDARHRRGASFDVAEADTKVRKKYLVALEEDDYSALPAPVYARGFLQIYAEYLGIDPHFADKLYQPPARSVTVEPLRPAASGMDAGSPISLRGVLSAALALLGAAAIFYLYAQYLTFASSQPPEVVSEPTAQVTATRPVVVAPLPSPSPTATPSPPEPSPTPVVGVEVVAHITERSWVRVTADGERLILFEGEMRPGETRTWKARDRIEMRVGNAAGVEVTVNGMYQGKLGASGEVKNVSWGRQ